MRNHTIYFKILLWILLFLTLSNCVPTVEKPSVNEQNNRLQTDLNSIIRLIYNRSLENCKLSAANLAKAVDSLAAKPTEANFSQARTQWTNLMRAYAHIEPYLYTAPDNMAFFQAINHRFITVSNIDYTETNTLSGIINDVINYPEITRDAINSFSQANGDAPMFGVEVIEFLL